MFYLFDIFILDNGVRLIFIFCLGIRGVFFVDLLKFLKEVGVQVVIMMMMLVEFSENQVDVFLLLCVDFYMDWFYFFV